MAFQHKGRGVKNQLRPIDFKRDKIGTPGKVVSIQYDPDYSLHLALVQYTDGEKRYILTPFGLEVGDSVIAGDGAELKPGNTLPLASIPIGTLIHNIESRPGRGGQLVRTGGGSARVVSKDDAYVGVRLPSGQLRKIPLNCLATIGQIRDSRRDIELAKTQPLAVIMPVSIAEEPELSLAWEETALSGAADIIFKVIITGCTPENLVTIHGNRYSLSLGWHRWHMGCKTDSKGKASAVIGCGYFDVRVVDGATGVETKAVTVFAK
jgi:hypothetical protein